MLGCRNALPAPGQLREARNPGSSPSRPSSGMRSPASGRGGRCPSRAPRPGPGDVRGDLRRPPRRGRPGAKALAQRLALEELHDENVAGRRPGSPGNRGSLRMSEIAAIPGWARCEQLRFPKKRADLLVFEEVCRQDLRRFCNRRECLSPCGGLPRAPPPAPTSERISWVRVSCRLRGSIAAAF